MRWVNRVFAAVMFSMAVWYGCQGVRGLLPRSTSNLSIGRSADPQTQLPQLVILGAPWCKNCTAMEKTTLKDPEVVKELAGFDVRHVEINTFDELKNYPELADLPIRGVPAYVVVAAPEKHTEEQGETK